MISFIFSIRQKLRVAISLIYLGIIVIVSLMPSEDVPQIIWFEGIDKLVHSFMYLGFTWLLCWSLHSEKKPFIIYFVIIGTIGWGILMELFQLIMQVGRAFEWLDVLANSVGVITGVLIYNLMINIKKGK